MKYYIIPVTKFYQNCSLIWCKKTKEAILVDPGGDARKIKKMIKFFNLKIKKILLTHGHLDHVGAAIRLSSCYKIPIFGPNIKDKPILKELPNQCKMFNYDIVLPFKPNYWLSEGNLINIGEIIFQVIHCPGHSPGHIAFFNKRKNFILTGDILFKGSIGRTDLPGGDKKTLIKSIEKLLLLSDNTIFLPGHGQISNVGYERYTNLFLKN